MFDFSYKEKLSQASESDEEDAEPLFPHKERIKKSRSKFTLIPILLVTHVLIAGFGILLGSRYILNPASFCIDYTQNYSPVVKDVAISYQKLWYNGSFLKANIFRQDAGPDVDAAWKSLGADYSPIRVPEDQAERSGLTRDHVKIRDKYGGGFPANVEGLHHLHCLNLLRKSLSWNYEYYKNLGEGPFKNEPYIVKLHVTHCLDILRQQLMCTVDIGVLGQVWWDPSFPKPFVDFNTQHICRNFENVREWAEERQLPPHVPDDFLEPPSEDVKIWNEIP